MKSNLDNKKILVQIEISYGTNVKYEITDHKLICDRFLHGPFLFPFNYGYIVDTLAGDGDPLDAVVLTNRNLLPFCYIDCKIIGALIMEDEKGIDEKIILIPHESIDPYSKHIKSIYDIDVHTLNEIEYFFEHYKDLEPNKYSVIKQFVDYDIALNIYELSKLVKDSPNNDDDINHNHANEEKVNHRENN